jgi:hypothetical protein
MGLVEDSIPTEIGDGGIKANSRGEAHSTGM